MTIHKVTNLTHKERRMPKGVPRSEGEVIGDKFDKQYRKMKNKTKNERAARKSGKGCKDKECACGKK